MNIPNVNYLHSAALLESLVAHGVRHAVISPGSRSTPLAHTAMEIPELECHVVIDERSASFFALGLSRARNQPAILICTSGTAAANYYPAIIEAAQSHVPLILLTADRPLALRNSGAPQTIDQSHLYGRYPKLFVDLPEAAANIQHCRGLRSVAAEAHARSVASPAGPVHLNVPFDEPLAPTASDEDTCRQVWQEFEQEGVSTEPEGGSAPTASRPDVDHIYDLIQRALCGLIVCGPYTTHSSGESEAVLRLARQLGWPVLADVISGVRFSGQPSLPHYDVFLREESLAALSPDVVLAFGAFPTSKVLNTYLDRHRSAHTIRIQPHLHRQDPTSRASEVILSDVEWMCTELADSVEVSRDSLLLEPFQQASSRAAAELETIGDDSCEALFVYDALREWPENGNVILSSSLPIRYADALASGHSASRRAFGLRGANGIDGTISHAAGIARADGQPTLLVLGDLAFVHDLNGLMIARDTANFTLLLLNNNGGGIFHFLPSHGTTRHFEAIQGTPHNLKLSTAAELFGLKWEPVATRARLGELLSTKSESARVLEVTMPREANHRAHTALFERLSHAAVVS